ncbi:MAG: hypothetical protein FD146_1010 [Anaerolineaceae bacterium]|nr:MAG: hypothetical protein FD146_1010 [Anaerolineaceae bacterium]
MDDNIFTIREEFLRNLDGAEAVKLFQDLIYAETMRVGIPSSKINISLQVNVPDGGIDATVDADINLSAGGLIESGNNSYQIKTGGDFNPNQKQAIKNELFGKKLPNKENLAPEVLFCLEHKGRYVLVCFGKDLTSAKRKNAIEHIKEFFEACGYPSARVGVWSLNNLILFFQPFPALVMKINRVSGLPFWTLAEWSNQADMSTSFEIDEEQKKYLNSIRDELRNNESSVHLRILGEAGVGKTRFVLEATNVDDLRPLVIYATASDFDQSSLMVTFVRNESWNAIIVLDECDPDQRARIWNNLKNHSPRIKLISIYNELDDVAGIPIYLLPGLSDNLISSIIQKYGVPKFEAGRWIPECGGSPRVAHVVGQNLRTNPEDILKPPANVNIWDRFICGRDKSDSENARQRRIVLQHIALFKRFGYEKPLLDEANTIHNLAQESDTLITRARFQEIINQLKKQHILQGKTTLYITPRLLHVKLWIDWWNLHGDSFDIDRVTVFPPRLIEWFFEMFEYAEGSPAASQKAKELLDENGVFQEGRGESLKKGFGARFFYHLTLAEPAAALGCLKRTIGTWSKEELYGLNQTRSLIVSSLEYIVLWGDLFPDAARLLLALGEAENQTYSNNASGVFTGLFQLSEHKELSKTEAPPNKRFQVLQEVLNGKSPEARRLGLEACKKALSWTSGGIIRDTHKIVGKRPDLWHPKIYGELFDAYREIWKLLLSSLDYLDLEERKIAYKNLLDSASNLARIHLLNEMILGDLEVLSKKEYAEKEPLIATVVRFVHDSRKEIPPVVYDRWDKFQKELTGSNYHDLLVRYIAMNLIDDEFGEAGEIVDRVEKKILELVDYGLSNQAELKAELRWLMSNDFYRARSFAYVIGKNDKEKSMYLDIVQTAKQLKGERTAAAFLGGYLQDCFIQDKNSWIKTIHSFAEDNELVYAIPWVIWHSHELTDDLVALLIKLAKSGDINPIEFSLFEYGSFLNKVSEKAVEEWFDFLLSQNDIAFTLIALSTHHQLYVYGNQNKTIPERLTFRLLTHPTFFTPSEKIRFDQMGEYNWKNIADRFIEQHPTHALEICYVVLEHFADDNSLFGRFFSEIHNIVGRVAQQYPEQVWGQIAEYLNPPYDGRAFGITHWLHGESEIFGEEDKPSPLNIFPPDAIWKWVDTDVNQRSWYLATFVPKTLHHDEDKICWAREILVRYGQLDSVKRNLIANFSSGSWSGSASLYFSRKLQKALDFRKAETDKKVIEWINDYIEKLERDIRREKIEEERDDY